MSSCSYILNTHSPLSVVYNGRKGLLSCELDFNCGRKEWSWPSDPKDLHNLIFSGIGGIQYDPAFSLWSYTQITQHPNRHFCIPMFIAVLFTIIKNYIYIYKKHIYMWMTYLCCVCIYTHTTHTYIWMLFNSKEKCKAQGLQKNGWT